MIDVSIVPSTGGVGVRDASQKEPSESSTPPSSPELVREQISEHPGIHSELGARGTLDYVPAYPKPKVSTRPKPKAPTTDRRLKHGRAVRWLHIAKGTPPAPARPLGSPEFEEARKNLAERLVSQGYRVGAEFQEQPLSKKKQKGSTYRRAPINTSAEQKEPSARTTPPSSSELVRE